MKFAVIGLSALLSISGMGTLARAQIIPAEVTYADALTTDFEGFDVVDLLNQTPADGVTNEVAGDSFYRRGGGRPGGAGGFGPRPGGGGFKPSRPSFPGGGGGGGFKPSRPSFPSGGGGGFKPSFPNRPSKPAGTAGGGFKPSRPGKPSVGGGFKPDKKPGVGHHKPNHKPGVGHHKPGHKPGVGHHKPHKPHRPSFGRPTRPHGHHGHYHKGGWHHRPGWHHGWKWNFHRYPRWWYPTIILPTWIWVSNIPVGYWQCTAFDEDLNAFSEIGATIDEAAYNALYECGGLDWEEEGCYVPEDYCRLWY